MQLYVLRVLESKDRVLAGGLCLGVYVKVCYQRNTTTNLQKRVQISYSKCEIYIEILLESFYDDRTNGLCAAKHKIIRMYCCL